MEQCLTIKKEINKFHKYMETEKKNHSKITRPRKKSMVFVCM